VFLGGPVKITKKYAKLAYENSKLLNGEDYPWTKRMKEYMENPPTI